MTAGTFLSRVFDASTGVNWQNINWVADVPAGTTLAISVRTGSYAGAGWHLERVRSGRARPD